MYYFLGCPSISWEGSGLWVYKPDVWEQSFCLGSIFFTSHKLRLLRCSVCPCPLPPAPPPKVLDFLYSHVKGFLFLVLNFVFEENQESHFGCWKSLGTREREFRGRVKIWKCRLFCLVSLVKSQTE